VLACALQFQRSVKTNARGLPVSGYQVAAGPQAGSWRLDALVEGEAQMATTIGKFSLWTTAVLIAIVVIALGLVLAR
jgi:hypothetical protein